MIKQVLSRMDYSFFAEASLVLFSLVFIAVVLRTLLTKSDITNQQAKIVLGENTENNS